jgi:hypothetical protein
VLVPAKLVVQRTRPFDPVPPTQHAQRVRSLPPSQELAALAAPQPPPTALDPWQDAFAVASIAQYFGRPPIPTLCLDSEAGFISALREAGLTDQVAAEY